jgi:hypothetical protein
MTNKIWRIAELLHCQLVPSLMMTIGSLMIVAVINVPSCAMASYEPMNQSIDISSSEDGLGVDYTGLSMSNCGGLLMPSPGKRCTNYQYCARCSQCLCMNGKNGWNQCVATGHCGKIKTSHSLIHMSSHHMHTTIFKHPSYFLYRMHALARNNRDRSMYRCHQWR